MSKNRTRSSIKNFIWSLLSGFITTILNMILRTIIVKSLGAAYLGIDGLFCNVLGILSFAELGIGSVIGFSLYKPLAENDTKKIQQLVNFYRSAYRVVALIVLVIGLSLIPFLPKIAKGAEGIEHLTFIYCVYIFNTVTSYLITYKSTVISADQKNYIITNINIVANIARIIIQCVVLLVSKDYIAYLIASSIFGFLRNIYINYYTTKKYPYLRNLKGNKLDKDDKSIIITKIKALLYHKIGEVAVFQTDNIITSTIINVSMVGYVSNYTMIINLLNGILKTFFSSLTPSFGNLIATEDKEHQIKVFNRIDFIGFWGNIFATTCLYFLLSPFIKIWLGGQYVLENGVVALLCINFFMQIMRLPVAAVKTAAAVVEPDKFSPIVEAVINLVISIICAKNFGIVGVYIGTITSSFVPLIWAPIVTFKYALGTSAKKYFVKYFKRTILLVLTIALMQFIFSVIAIQNDYLMFLVRFVICLVVPNVIMIIIYHKSEEYKYFIDSLKGLKSKLLHR